MAFFTKACGLFAAVGFLVLSAPGQTTQAPAEMVTRSQSATFPAGTSEVEVPVVVRDGKGQAVGGLRLEDFRLFDKGKPQVVSRAAAVNSSKGADRGDGPSAVPERFTMCALDDLARVSGPRPPGSWTPTPAPAIG
jgi:hypothetical protein